MQINQAQNSAYPYSVAVYAEDTSSLTDLQLAHGYGDFLCQKLYKTRPNKINLHNLQVDMQNDYAADTGLKELFCVLYHGINILERFTIKI